jgi:hypothetical protein
MYLNKEGDVIKGLSTRGHLAVGVPCTVPRTGVLPNSELDLPMMGRPTLWTRFYLGSLNMDQADHGHQHGDSSHPADKESLNHTRRWLPRCTVLPVARLAKWPAC